jgi:hypothetical protein
MILIYGGSNSLEMVENLSDFHKRFVEKINPNRLLQAVAGMT